MTLSLKTATLASLYLLWDQLDDISTGDAGENADCLEQIFLHFPVGTPREEVWHWFEGQNPNFVVGDVMQGIRVSEAAGSAGAPLHA